MKNILIYVVIGIVLVLMLLWQQVSAKKLIAELSNLLYEKQDGKAYLDKLNSFAAKVCMQKKKRLFMSIDGYALLDDGASIERTFKEVEGLHLSYGNKIGLYQKEVQYYVDAKKYDEAIRANDELQKLAVMIKDANMDVISEEANTLIEVYCNRNASYAEIMVEKAKKQTNKFTKGIFYYRAAKCYYYGNDEKNVQKYLEHAVQNVTGEWRKHVEACMEDHSKLDLK